MLSGKLSARSKLEGVALIILLGLCVLTYKRGAHNAELATKVGELDRQREILHDTIKVDMAVVADLRKKSDETHAAVAKIVARSDSFKLKPVPSLQTPANEPLIRVIANRDSALAVANASISALKFEVAQLRSDRASPDKLIADLIRQADLDKSEIAKLKQFKSPRFGWKTGVIVGLVTAVAVDAGVKHYRK